MMLRPFGTRHKATGSFASLAVSGGATIGGTASTDAQLEIRANEVTRAALALTDNTHYTLRVQRWGSHASTTGAQIMATAGTNYLALGANGVEKMFIRGASMANAAAIGVGVIPSLWQDSAGNGMVQVGSRGSLATLSGGQDFHLTHNAYWTGAQWTRIAAAATYTFGMYNDGSADGFSWRYAASGAAGGAVSWSTLARLTSTGLGIGGTPADTLHVFAGASGKGISVTAPASGAATLNLFNNNQSSGEFEIGQGWASGTDNIGYILNRSNAAVVFGMNSAEVMRMSAAGLSMAAGATVTIPNGQQFKSGAGYALIGSSGPDGDVTLYNGSGILGIRLGGALGTASATNDYDANTHRFRSFNGGATTFATLNATGLGLGTTSFGAGAEKVLSVGSGVAPTTGPADTVQFYSSDDAAGHTIPSFYCEGTNVVATEQADSASSVRVKMRINGTVRTFLCI